MFTRCKIFLNSIHNLWNISKKIDYDFLKKLTVIPSSSAMETRPTVALVLGGGGARGLAHIGVLEELEKAGIAIDMIVGCSSGSLVGALYADQPNAQIVKNILFKLKKRDLINFNFLNSRYGLGKGQALRRVLKKHLTTLEFDQLKIPFSSVATDLKTGELVVLNNGPIVPAVHASCALPFYFEPVMLHDRVLVDGGVVNSVPTSVAKQHNPQIIVAVDLNQSLKEALPSHLFGVAKRSWEIVLFHQSKRCLSDADIVIRPDLHNIGLFDETYNHVIYEAGREAALQAIPEIKKSLS